MGEIAPILDTSLFAFLTGGAQLARLFGEDEGSHARGSL